MKKKRRLRAGVYDFIIYVCLFGAVICLLIGSNSYLKNYETESITDVAKQVFLGTPKSNATEIDIVQVEPEKVLETDKVSVINTYLEKIKDRIIVDELIPYDTIITWNNYEIKNLTFVKEITSDYFEYTFDLYLNKDAILPLPKNNELSNDNQNVLSLKAFIQEKDSNYILKKIDPINIVK